MNYKPLDHEYDQVPYPMLSHGNTHPNQLAAIGNLLNLNPASPDECRVLELGCASGGNLIPMACALPKSQFLGIDYSTRQIEDGLRAIEELGLRNISLMRMDILDVPADFGQFDYIIAHGVYSWVPPPVRDGIFRICRDRLSDQGIAYVSYNTYPGWHMLEIVRDIMAFASRRIDDIEDIAARGREIIEFITRSVPDSQPSYRAFLESYLENLVEKREVKGGTVDQLILHDELASFNQPVKFHEFAEHAAEFDLQYLAEASFSSVMANDISPETVKKLEELSDDLVEFEQYLDFLKNRSFRKTLLCHSSLDINRKIRPESITKLRIASLAIPESEQPDLSPKVVEAFVGKDGAKFRTDHPLSKAAFLYLRETRPQSTSFSDLIKNARKKLLPELSPETEQEQLILSANILQAYTYSDSLVELHSIELPFTLDIPAKPRVSAVARWAISKGFMVTNFRHERVELDLMAEKIASRLDGTNSRSDLLLWMLEEYERGNISFKKEKIPQVKTEDVKQELQNDMEQILVFLSEVALFEAETP